MEEWYRLGQNLRKFINPDTFPVAVRFMEDESLIPSNARRPSKDLNVKMAPCQGAAMARRYGWTVAFSNEDSGCAIADHTYGWKRAEEENVVRFLTVMNYASDEESARQIASAFQTLDMGDNPAVVYSPLERTKVEPDVILIYVNPAQLMRLIHGATYGDGKPVGGSFSGRAASCTEGVIGSYLTKSVRIVVPGNGDRVWAGCQDHEMLMAVPAGLLAGIVKGLEMTHQRGIRYPIPTYLKYTPEVAFSLPLSGIFDPEQQKRLNK